MEDKNVEFLEKLYATDKNVAIISRDVEGLKEDIKDIKKSLQKLLEEPSKDYAFFKNKVMSLIVTAIVALALLGFGTWCMRQTTETRQIVQEYQLDNK